MQTNEQNVSIIGFFFIILITVNPKVRIYVIMIVLRNCYCGDTMDIVTVSRIQISGQHGVIIRICYIQCVNP